MLSERSLAVLRYVGAADGCNHAVDRDSLHRHGPGAGPTSEQHVQLPQYSKGGQAGAAAFVQRLQVMRNVPDSWDEQEEVLVNSREQKQELATRETEPDSFDVLAHFPVALPDGGVDVTDALLDIIYRIPDGGSFLPHSDRRQNASVLHFPTWMGRGRTC